MLSPAVSTVAPSSKTGQGTDVPSIAKSVRVSSLKQCWDIASNSSGGAVIDFCLLVLMTTRVKYGFCPRSPKIHSVPRVICAISASSRVNALAAVEDAAPLKAGCGPKGDFEVSDMAKMFLEGWPVPKIGVLAAFVVDEWGEG